MALQSIETLLNGTIFFISDGNLTGHVYPPLVYQAIPEQSIVRIIDNFNTIIPIDTSIDFINGVAFSGNYAQLQIDIEAAVDAANIEFENFNSAVSGGSATADNQDTQITQITNYLGKKAIGKILDLANTNGSNSWGGYPLNLVDPPLFSFVFNFGLNFSIESGLTASNATDLVSILNNAQNYIVFSVISETSLLMNDGTKTLNNLASITIDTSNWGDLFWDAFTDSPAVPLSNLDEINERLKSAEANIAALLAELKLKADLTETQPVSIQTGAVGSMLQEIQTTGLWRGKIAKVFNLIGQRNGFTSTSVMNDVKEYDNGVANVANTSNSTLDIISSSASDSAAGTGARTVKVTYIDNANNLVESAAIALNGTTLVTSVLTGVNQVLWMETATAGSGGVAAGNIRLRINGGVVEVEQITAGGNKSRSAVFQVPTGYTGYVAGWRVSAVQNDQDVRLRGTVNTIDNSLATLYHYMSQKYAANNTSISMHDIWLKVPALARIKASTVSNGTAATVRCNVNILMVIIEN